MRQVKQDPDARKARTTLLMQQLRPVLEFLGYGNPRAPVWFVGLEEGLPVGADVAAHLLVRSTFPRFLDCATAHMALGIHNLHGLADSAVIVQSTWRQMSYLMLALSGMTEEGAGRRVADYQANLLGAKGGQSLLVELMPLPRSRQNSWPYAELFGDVWENNRDYQQAVWPLRRDALRSALERYAPKLVVCYGGGALASRRFDELMAPDVLKNLHDTTFRIAYRRGRVVLHVPHFSQRSGAFPRDEFLCCSMAAALIADMQLPLL
jgi:hypothetical protein